jgi:DNA-binding XRE family transcriptional regulator
MKATKKTNGRAKLTWAKVAKLRAWLKANPQASRAEKARELGVDRNTVYRIESGSIWVTK